MNLPYWKSTNDILICCPATAFNTHGHVKTPHPVDVVTLLASVPLPAWISTLELDNWQQYGSGMTTNLKNKMTLEWSQLLQYVIDHWLFSHKCEHEFCHTNGNNNFLIFELYLSYMLLTWVLSLATANTHLLHMCNLLGDNELIPWSMNSLGPSGHSNPKTHLFEHCRTVDPSKVHLVLVSHCCKKTDSTDNE